MNVPVPAPSDVSSPARDLARDGYAVVGGVFSPETVERLRAAYFKALRFCAPIQERYNIAEATRNTVHHVLFLDPVFVEVLTAETFLEPVSRFFGGSKFVLNSIGGNNNDGHFNYAANIHRDVRFHSQDPMMLNTIIAVSDLTPESGSTELMIGSEALKAAPDSEAFASRRIQLTCPAGGVVYFDSRIWHRAGRRTAPPAERIIFTPIFSRPFIKPGFDYARALAAHGLSGSPEMLQQLCGYFSDIPETHDQWYNLPGRRFYHKDQDL